MLNIGLKSESLVSSPSSVIDNGKNVGDFLFLCLTKVLSKVFFGYLKKIMVSEHHCQTRNSEQTS